MAVRKHHKKMYARAVPLLIIGVMLLAVSAIMYEASAKSHTSSDVAHGLFTPLSSINGNDGKAGIRAQKQSETNVLHAFPAAGSTAGETLKKAP